MKYYMLVLFLSGFVVANNVINLDKLESYSYKPMFNGPALINITSTKSIDVTFEQSDFTFKCINKTECIKGYDVKCHKYITTSITIISNDYNNIIRIVGNDHIGCNWIDINWTWLTLFIVIFICFAILCMCSLWFSCHSSHKNLNF